ncbi:MAG: tRNA methyltransferase [Candidatus Diapherotrites archaeon CG08_land_8_20_14_0_20_34_12]|nr:MAG: tRNA methyltransferase [Candidatus Diapherotrites archaeon CG08_land_8_20_14_0_20_34_12]
MKKTFLPETFVEKYKELLGKDSEKFFKSCCTKIPKSIWANSLRINPKELEKMLKEKGWKLKSLTFNQNAFLLENIERPGDSDEFKQGFFNIQERASMLPVLVLDPQKGERILDLTAAPGSKTLQISCLLQGTGKILAIEKEFNRYKSLLYNIGKFEMKNVQAKCMNALIFKEDNSFDKVLLDAPCSSEGLVRKEFGALKHWSPHLVKRKSKLQKRLILKAYDALKENGILVYSVCSLSPEECENVIDFLLKKRNAAVEKIKIKGIKCGEGILKHGEKEFNKEVKNCCRLWPHKNDCQAFFIAKIRKK